MIYKLALFSTIIFNNTKEKAYPITKADMEVPIKAYIRIAPRFLKKYLCKNLIIKK